ncbi:MAG: hypothetical protein JXL84_11080, partial [Deltaproteobacteria bacterium]|nr:hypothetical protein [Deltaproteobacteria bacterium]
HSFEWADVKQALKALQEVIIQENGTVQLLRSDMCDLRRLAGSAKTACQFDALFRLCYSVCHGIHP